MGATLDSQRSGRSKSETANIDTAWNTSCPSLQSTQGFEEIPSLEAEEVEAQNETSPGEGTSANAIDGGTMAHERRHSGSGASDGDRPKADSSGLGGGYFDDDDVNFDADDLEDVLA